MRVQNNSHLMLQITQNSPPFEILIGGAKESLTKEQMLQISAQMLGCRERSKIRARTQQERAKERAQEHEFLEKKRERERGKILTWTGHLVGPGALVARPGGCLCHLAAWLGGGPPGSAPGASGSLLLHTKLI